MEARPVDSAEDLSHPKNAVRKTYTYFGQSNAQPVPEWGFARDEYAAKIGPRAAITLYAALMSQLRKSSLTPSHFIRPSASFVAGTPIQSRPDSPSARREWERIPAFQHTKSPFF